MVKLPAWDTPTWHLPHELRPFYAAAAMELTRLVDALQLFKAERATVAYFGQA